MKNSSDTTIREVTQELLKASVTSKNEGQVSELQSLSESEFNQAVMSFIEVYAARICLLENSKTPSMIAQENTMFIKSIRVGKDIIEKLGEVALSATFKWLIFNALLTDETAQKLLKKKDPNREKSARIADKFRALQTIIDSRESAITNQNQG